MSILDFFRRGPRHNPEHKAAAEQRLQRVMQGFQAELESMRLPTETAAPGEMPEVLSRPMEDYDGDQAEYPWEKKRRPDEESASEGRRRY